MKGCCVIRQLSAVIRSGWSGFFRLGYPACFSAGSSLGGADDKAVDIYEQLAGEDSLDFFVNYQLARLISR